MYSLLSGLKSHLKRQEITVDNVVFRIHCTFTTVLLISFSLIITWTQFVGQPIRCVPSTNGPPQHILNLFCWTTSTFLIPDLFGRISSSALFPGIGASRYNHQDYQSQQKYYSYYQYVTYILLLQAMFFYLPNWFWSWWEGGFMKTLVYDLQVKLRSEEDTKERKAMLVEYLSNHANQFKWYSYRYLFCELLCAINVFSQLLFMNWFFRGDFVSYGINVLNFDSQDIDDRTDYMITVFPRMTKCSFKTFGGSGTIQTFDSLCLLPLNIVNEKTYIFLWFWFITLAVLTSLLVLFRMTLCISPRVRGYVMKARYRMISAHELDFVSEKISMSNWWIVYMLGRNMDPYIYGQVVSQFAKKLAKDN